MLRMFENKGDARTRAHSQSCRETVDTSADTFARSAASRTPSELECDASAHRFHPYRGLLNCRDLSKSAWRHRSDFLPILEDASASRRRLELCRTRADRRTPTGALVGGVNNLVDAACQLTSIRPAFCNCVHLFGSGVRIHREASSRMRANAARFWKSECIMIGNQDCISCHTCRHRLPVVHSASQLPGSRQDFVISLCGGRLCD